MRALLPLLLLALFATAAQAQSFNVASGGRIWVEGTSTVHDWSCEAPQFTGSFNGQADGATLTSLTGGTVTVTVARMECRNGTMNGKLREALQASSHPSIRYTLTRATIAPSSGNRFTVNTTGQLTIAGTTRPITMAVQGQSLGNGVFRFTGQAPVTMTQFGVRRPSAMAGTIRTGDQVTVRFDVTVGR